MHVYVQEVIVQVVIFRVGTEYFALEGDRVGGIVEEEKTLRMRRHLAGISLDF